MGRGEDRRIDVVEEVGEGADVILGAVGDDDPPDRAAPLEEPVERGMDDVDAVVLVGKRDAAVDDDDVIALREGETVHPDFAQTTQRNDAEMAGGGLVRRHLGLRS